MARRVHIRPFCREDEESVRKVWAETWHATYDALRGHAEIEESLNRIRLQTIASIYLGNASSRMLVAEIGGRIAGTITCSENGSRPVIHGLFVLPGFQRRGVGSLLLRKLLSSMPECEISLKALAAHSHVIAFYQRHGFVVAKTLVQPLYGSNQDMVEMRLSRRGTPAESRNCGSF